MKKMMMIALCVLMAGVVKAQKDEKWTEKDRDAFRREWAAVLNNMNDGQIRELEQAFAAQGLSAKINISFPFPYYDTIWELQVFSEDWFNVVDIDKVSADGVLGMYNNMMQVDSSGKSWRNFIRAIQECDISFVYRCIYKDNDGKLHKKEKRLEPINIALIVGLRK